MNVGHIDSRIYKVKILTTPSLIITKFEYFKV